MHFLYPWFLVGLVALAIPVLIHLLQLRRPQRVLFTNTAFIRDVELITVRHRKVQHLFILLMRMLVVGALVTAFCQPFIPNKEGNSGGGSGNIGVVVDNSFSMQQVGRTEQRLFDEAVGGARSLGNAGQKNGKFLLINNTNRIVVGGLAYELKLDNLKFNARNVFSNINSRTTEAGSQYSAAYVFSDFQKNSFSSGIIGDFGREQQVNLVPLIAKQQGNVYVDSVWVDDALVRVKTNVALNVRLRNGGGAMVSDCAVKVFLGRQQVAVFRVTVEPGQVATKVVQVQVKNEALAQGRIVTEDAPVTFDNAYYFTLQPAAVIRVLEIGAEPVAERLYRNEPLFAYSFVTPQRVDYGTLRRANMVLVRELNAIDAGLREALRAVVREGGSVVVVPSPLTTSRDSYQQLFRELGLGTVQWEAKAAAPELRELAMPSAQEPFFRDVFGARPRAATMPRVAPVLRWSRTGTDILRLRDGESYLASFENGAGRMYVFSAPFAKEYTDFATHALFVPVMYRLAMLSYQTEQLPAYRLTQGAVSVRLPMMGADGAIDEAARRDEADLRLVKDSLTLIPAQRIVGQEVRLELPAGMNEPGFYQVQRRGKVLTTLAFNQNKRESELAAYSADELRAMIGPNRPNITVLEVPGDGAGLAALQARQNGQPLWRYWVALALVGLLAEALLVRFGRRRARTEAAR